MGMTDLVNQLRQLDDCEVQAPSGIPSVAFGLRLPRDLEEFYRLCGGATLYRGADYSIDIVSPDDFVRANPIIAGEEGEEDISFNWYIIAQSGEQYITIDLHQDRLGRCYDSFWDRHGVPGECQILSMSFEGLLQQLISCHGEYWYWLHEDFQNLGDAYD